MALALITARAETPKNGGASLSIAEADNEVVERATCHKGNDERFLEVIPKERGCVLRYTKGGKAEDKATSVHGVQICQDTLKKMRQRLEKSEFKCE